MRILSGGISSEFNEVSKLFTWFKKLFFLSTLENIFFKVYSTLMEKKIKKGIFFQNNRTIWKQYLVDLQNLKIFLK